MKTCRELICHRAGVGDGGHLTGGFLRARGLRGDFDRAEATAGVGFQATA